MIPAQALQLLDTATLISILFQLTDRPEATADDLALWRAAAAIVAERLVAADAATRPAHPTDHPFTGIATGEIKYRVEVDPSWRPSPIASGSTPATTNPTSPAASTTFSGPGGPP